MKTSEITFALLVANITASYYQAIQYPLVVDAGLSWYSTARNQAVRIAARNRVSVECAAGIISALSPRNRWERNLLDADLLLKNVAVGNLEFKVSTFHENKSRAIAIANGTKPLDVLSGNKTRAFYQNILTPDHPHIVTVDIHAFYIALGARTIAYNLSDAQYAIFANAYRTACKRINKESLERVVLPSQVQAVTWTHYRVIHGFDKSFEV